MFWKSSPEHWIRKKFKFVWQLFDKVHNGWGGGNERGSYDHMHFYRENIHVLANIIQVSDVAHGPLVVLVFIKLKKLEMVLLYRYWCIYNSCLSIVRYQICSLRSLRNSWSGSTVRDEMRRVFIRLQRLLRGGDSKINALW
jgi:hypothetical protein